MALSLLESRVAAMIGWPLDAGFGGVALPAAVGRDVAHDLGWLADVMSGPRPGRAVAHCLCLTP